MFAFYSLPETGEASIKLIESDSITEAKARAVEMIKRRKLRGVRFWDGDRVIEVYRPRLPVPAHRADNPEDRATRMIALKAEGKTQREIATAFGITSARVRQIIEDAQSRTYRRTTQPNYAALSTRAQNALRSLIAATETDPAERDRRLPERIAALTPSQILQAVGSGKKTLAEVKAWLWERGLCLNNEA